MLLMYSITRSTLSALITALPLASIAQMARMGQTDSSRTWRAAPRCVSCSSHCASTSRINLEPVLRRESMTPSFFFVFQYCPVHSHLRKQMLLLAVLVLAVPTFAGAQSVNSPAATGGTKGPSASPFAHVRQLLNQGKYDEAIAQL